MEILDSLNRTSLKRLFPFVRREFFPFAREFIYSPTLLLLLFEWSLKVKGRKVGDKSGRKTLNSMGEKFDTLPNKRRRCYGGTANCARSMTRITGESI